MGDSPHAEQNGGVTPLSRKSSELLTLTFQPSTFILQCLQAAIRPGPGDYTTNRNYD